jgi:L-lactate utilization protein LutC
MIGLSVVNSFLKAASRNGAHVVQTRDYEEVARIVSRIASENNVSSIALARMRGPLLKALRNELASMKTVFNLDDYRLEEAAKIAENVEMGVTLVDAGLAEVGVVVILDGYSARLASTLPRRLAAILPASQIIPTYDQLAELLARRYRGGRRGHLDSWPERDVRHRAHVCPGRPWAGRGPLHRRGGGEK